MSGPDHAARMRRAPPLRYVPPDPPRTVYIDGRRITVGCSALEDRRWVPAISVDPPTDAQPRRIYTAGSRHAQPSPTAAITLAHVMARDWSALIERDPIALANWLTNEPVA